jgi:hypothetical protein
LTSSSTNIFEEAQRLLARDRKILNMYQDAENAAKSWRSGPTISPGPETVFRQDPKTSTFLRAMNSSYTGETNHMPLDRTKYDVHETYDAIADTLNAAIENIAHDLTEPGVANINGEGLVVIRSAFDSLVTIRNDFLKKVNSFATQKPEPTPEVTPDENGMIYDKYGNLVGKLAVPTASE